MAEIRGRTVNGGEVEFYDAASGDVVFRLNGDTVALLNAVETTTDPNDGSGAIWNDEGTLKVAGAGD